MAIDRTGISSLETGAPDITYTGDEGPKDPRTMSDIDKIILQHWLQQGGSYGDVIPEEFKLEIIKMYGLDKMASAQDMAGGGIARIGLRRGGNPHIGGYGPTADSTSRGPAGGASAGGNYGGNRNPNQGYADPGPVSQHHSADTPKQIADQKKLDLMYATTGTGSDPNEKIDTPLEETNIVKDAKNWIDKHRFNALKFTQGPWTYDKQKRFFNTLSAAQKKALGYGKHFQKDWDDLEDWEKNMLGSYDVYNDLLGYGYGNWLEKDYESKWGPKGEEEGKYLNQLKLAQARSGIGGIDITPETDPETETETDTGTDTTTTSDPFQVASFSEADLDRIYGTSIPTTGTLGWTRPSPNILQHQFAADGGRMGYAGGGIADLRQAYGLGKLVKKIGKTVKKVAKSPFGKMALMVGLGGLGGFGPAAGLKGSALGKFLMGTGLPTSATGGPSTGFLGKMLLNKGTGWSMANISPWKAIGGLSALGGLYTSMTNKEDEEDDLMKQWLAQKQAADAYWGPRFEDAFADGGRIGFKRGSKGKGSTKESTWDTDKIKKDLGIALDWSLPGAIGNITEGIAGIAKTNQTEIMNVIKKLVAVTPPGQIGEVINFIVDRYKIDPELVQKMVISQMTDANIGFEPPVGTADEGYRPEIGIDAGAEDPWDIPQQSRKRYPDAREWLDKIKDLDWDKVKPIPMPGSEPTPLHPDATKIPHHLDVNPLQTMEFRDANQDGIEDRSQGIYAKDRDLIPWDPGRKKRYLAYGGRIGAQEGGLMDLGGMEKDYRNEGGFVPIGGQERADDVPARLSKNEFVFTADAVRAAGGGDIDKGAEVMENVMENLEKGGNISEESQGLEGARNMFATSQRLEGVL